MNLFDFVSKMTAGEVAGWGLIVLILLLSIVQISPLKLNPWDKIFGWIGQKTNGKMQEQLNTLQGQVREMWINKHRQTLLIFARECRAGIEHSSDEWINALNVAEEYERYCESHAVTNGIVKADTAYIRDLYLQLSREHRI